MDDEEVICISIDFSLPLTVTYRLHTCHYRKFVGINIACHTNWCLALKEPEINCVSQPPANSVIKLISLDPVLDPLTVSIHSFHIVGRFYYFYCWVKY